MNNNTSSIFKRIALIQSEWDLLSEKEKARRRQQTINWSEMIKSNNNDENSHTGSDKNNSIKQ